MGIAQRQMEARVSAALRLELRLVAEAVRLVASGAAPSVTLAGLRFGDALLGDARELASRHRVHLVLRWPADETGLAFTIEREPSGSDADHARHDGLRSRGCMLGHDPDCPHAAWADADRAGATRGLGLPRLVSARIASEDVVAAPVPR